MLMKVLFTLTIVLSISSAVLYALEPTSDEMDVAQKWISNHFSSDVSKLPFSFQYAGQPSGTILPNWTLQRTQAPMDKNRTKHVLLFTDKNTRLELRCEAIEFRDYPAVEWIIFFKNTGDQDTPVLQEIQAFDLSLQRMSNAEFTIHYANGGQIKPDDFMPISETLLPNTKLKFGSTYELSSGQKMPFYNLEFDQQGMIVAVGWSGSWIAQMIRDADKGLRVKTGVSTQFGYDVESTAPLPWTELLLHPGEEICTPRMLMLFWQKDRIRAHNIWRRFLLEYYVLRRQGQIIQAPLCDLNWGLRTEQQQINKINWWAENNLPMEVFWIDAGWSGTTGLKLEEWGIGAANRIPRPDLYPNGLKPISDAAHQQGMKFLLWVWPHTVLPGVEIAAEHPDWVVPGNGLDYGDPAVNQWMIERYSKMVEEFGLDYFRQDGHPIVPADTGPDRKGFFQIRYIEGFYKFWDALLKRHPDLIIDNCAAGGRKIDIETMQRSIPLWRSDIQVDVNFNPVHMQGQTYGISFWVPLSGGVASKPLPYFMRSGYGPALCCQWHIWDKDIVSEGFDFKTARKLLNEYLAIRSYFYGDYYPLTTYSIKEDVWMAWQFDNPEEGEGVVQFFRRAENGEADQKRTFPLRGLDLQAQYELVNFDVPGKTTMTGRELKENGLVVDIPTHPAAVIITYKKIR